MTDLSTYTPKSVVQLLRNTKVLQTALNKCNNWELVEKELQKKMILTENQLSELKNKFWN